VPLLGYEGASAIAQRAQASGRGVRELAIEEGLLDAAGFDALVSPEAVSRLGMPGLGAGGGEKR